VRLKRTGKISPTTDNFKIKFYTPLVCSCLCKITKFYSVVFNFDKVTVVCAAVNETAAAARRPAVTGGGGANKMAAAIGGVSEPKIQDFQPSLK